MIQKKAIVIGAGFAGLSAACHLAKSGFSVSLLEKNETVGGRARHFSAQGFSFDMGPSWYWMPDVFDRFFESFGKKTSDYYTLKRLDPSYRVYWGKADFWDVPADFGKMKSFFESIEKGAAQKLEAFMKDAAYKYEVGINDLVYKPGKSLMEFADLRFLIGLAKLDVLKPYSAFVRKYFKNPRLLQLMEFPILFLGAVPANTPALYSLMNYADIKLGTWYPEGGMWKVAEAMYSLALSLGVEIKTGSPVEEILLEKNKAVGVKAAGGSFFADVIVAGADYRHVEKSLLPVGTSDHDDKYWESRTMAPSCLIYYLGVSKKLQGFEHHTLFFDQDFALHADEIYTHPQWPSNPLLYVSAVSKTDSDAAPEGMENIFVLIPVAPGLNDTEEVRERFYRLAIERLESLTGQEIGQHVVYKRVYAHREFIKDYNAYKGNAYGLANTLMQTSLLKPSLQSKKIKNLYFTGQLTVPGPGVPPSIISGAVVAGEIMKKFN